MNKSIPIPIQKGPLEIPLTEKSKTYAQKEKEAKQQADMIHEFQKQVAK